MNRQELFNAVITLHALYRTSGGVAFWPTRVGDETPFVYGVFPGDGSTANRHTAVRPHELTPADPEDFPDVDFSHINLVPHPPRYLTEKELEKEAPCWAEDKDGQAWHLRFSEGVLIATPSVAGPSCTAQLLDFTRILDYPIPGKDGDTPDYEAIERKKLWDEARAVGFREGVQALKGDLPERVRVENRGALWVVLVGNTVVDRCVTESTAHEFAESIRAGLREEEYRDV